MTVNQLLTNTKVNLDISKGCISIQVPEDFNLQLSTNELINIQSLELESDNLYQSFIDLTDKMQMTINMTKPEVHYQNWLLYKLERINYRRLEIETEIRAIKLNAVSNSLLILEDLIKDKVIHKPKAPVKKVTTKPSNRWYKK